MEFIVLDRQTIQCVMTEAEIADYGMDRQAIYENDKRTEDFFRKIMKKAQQETGFRKKRGDITVHASFLPDELLKITFFIGRKELFDDFDEEASAEFSIAVLKSKELMNIAAFCGKTGSRLKAALYKDRGVYFLLADISRCQVREIAQLLCLADEYVDEICYTKSIAAFLREHGQCVIKENAAAVLGNL